MGNFSIDQHLYDDDRNTGRLEIGNDADEAVYIRRTTTLYS